MITASEMHSMHRQYQRYEARLQASPHSPFSSGLQMVSAYLSTFSPDVAIHRICADTHAFFERSPVMQKLLGQMRCAVDRYHMIAKGTASPSAYPGGKDSVALARRHERFAPLLSCPLRVDSRHSLDPCFGGMKQTIPPLSSCAASWKSPTGCGARSSAKLSLKHR